MRRTAIIILLTTVTLSASAQNNLTLNGRWGEGRCEAVFRRSGYTFTGNGAKLELFKMSGSYKKLPTSALLPGPIEDIWVASNLQYVYVACGEAGVYIVPFDEQNEEFGTVIGGYNTPGYAHGITQSGSYAYVADGNNGMFILFVGSPSNPLARGTFKTASYAEEVWLQNDSTLFVAADSAGLYSVNVKDKSNPIALDSLSFSESFPGYHPRSYHVISLDTVAYVADGWGGLRIVDIRNRSNLNLFGTWTYGGTPRDVREVWVENGNAVLACLEYGLFTHIDVSDVHNPTGPRYQPLDTDGFTSAVVIQSDTAYVADGYNGHLQVVVPEAGAARIIKQHLCSDYANDVIISGNYAYTANGRSGVGVIKLTDIDPVSKDVGLVARFDTTGQALGLSRRASRLFVANGSRGLLVLNVSNPETPYAIQSDIALGDTCYNVDAPLGDFAYLACGLNGMRVVDHSTSPISELVSDRVNTPGICRSVKVVNGKAYLADSDGVYVYNVSGLPSVPPSLENSLVFGSINALDLDVRGDSVYVANGRFGFLIWNVETNEVVTYETGGVCTDVSIQNRTLYVSDGKNGVRIFDLSRPGQVVEPGNYNTNDFASSVHLENNLVGVADGRDGVYILESAIKPEIAITPASRLDFGPVPTGKKRPLILWIVNTGTALLEGSLSIPPEISGEFELSQQKFSVPPSDTAVVDVAFAPNNSYSIGTNYNTTLSIISNDPDNSNIPVTLQWEGGIEAHENNQYTSDIFTMGLWHLNETGGTQANDSSPNNLDGELVGDASFVASSKTTFTNAVQLDGSGDRVKVEYDNHLNFQDIPFTAEMWFKITEKPTENKPNAILLQRGIGDQKQFQIALVDDSQPVSGLYAYLNGSFPDSTYVLSTGSLENLAVQHWYHVALTSDREYIRLYLNGVLRDSTRQYGKLAAAVDEGLGIGDSYYGNAPFNGQVDEVRLSNIARQTWEFHVNRSRLLVSEDTLNYASVLRGNSRELPLTLSNAGSQQLLISNISLQNGNDSFDTGFSSVITLGAGEDTTIQVTFNPAQQGDEEDILQISSSDPTYPVISVDLMGTGVKALPAGSYDTDLFTIGLYHFEEQSGTVIEDSSGNEMSGVTKVSMRSDNGRFGKGLIFRDGQNDIATINPPGNYPISPRWGGLSVEGWFLVETLPQDDETLIGRGDNSWRQFEIWLNGPTIYGRVYSNDAPQQIVTLTSAAKGDVRTGQWNHYALSFQSDSITLYLNGDAAETKPFPYSMADRSVGQLPDTNKIRIGRDWSGSRPFVGRMDEIRISNTGRKPWEFNVDMARANISATSLDFDQVLVGKSRTLKLEISNTGIDNLTISNLQVNHSNYSVQNNSFVVTPGGSNIIKVTYTPSDTATHQGLLVMNSNDPFQRQIDVQLTGKGSDVPIISSYQSDIFTTGLYHMDSGSGQNMVDGSSKNQPGSIHGAAWSINAVFGSNSLSLDGVNDYLSISDTAGVLLTGTEYTVEMWFSLKQVPQDRRWLMRRASSAGSKFELFFDPAAGIKVVVADSAAVTDSLATGIDPEFNVDQWYNVNVSWDGDSLRLRLNKILVGSTLWHGVFDFLSTQPVRIGGTPSGGTLPGYIDEIRFSSLARETWELHVRERELHVDPVNLDFAVVLNDQVRTLQLGVGNLGDQNLSVLSISGGDEPFAIPDSLRQFTLGRRSTQAIPVSYHPQAANVTHKDSLVITAEDTTITVHLTGSSTDSRTMKQYTSDTHTNLLYHLDEGSGTIAIDASGNANGGYITNGAQWSTGVFNSACLYFDGYNDFIRVPYSSELSFDVSRQSFTIECYFRTDTVDQGLIYLGDPDSANYGLEITPQGRIGAAGFGSGGTRVNDDAWHHTALMYDHLTGKGTIYLDGVRVWQGMRTTPAPSYKGRSLCIAARDSVSGYFNGSIDEVRISDIPREIWEFRFVNYGIEIALPNQITYRTDLPLIISVPSSITPASNGVKLYYRAGGGQRYNSVTAIPSGDAFSATIPAAGITLRGLEYYLEIVTATGDTISDPLLDPAGNPHALQVHHNGTQVPVTLPYRQFTMISFPYQLDETRIDSALSNLGPYNPYVWELFWWDPSLSQQRWTQGRDTTYIHITDPDFDIRAVPGRSYWLATATQTSFSIGGGNTVTTDSSYVIKAAHGWNMIADPFNFNIAWKNCSLSDSLMGPYFYDYSISDGPIQDWPVLQPWEGYWVYNPHPDTVEILIMPKQTDLSLPGKDGQLSLSRPNGWKKEGDWRIRLSAAGNLTRDIDNYAGLSQRAADEWDQLDAPEPPEIREHVNLFFDHSEWLYNPAVYASDFRSTAGEGQIWMITVSLPENENTLTLSWQAEVLPAGWQAVILNMDERFGVNINEQNSITVEALGRREFSFKLVAGTPAFIENESEGISTQPVSFALEQNYPNPFNPETTIHYSLPQKLPVKLVVFNMLGQKIRTLVEKPETAGMHQVIWDGKDFSGKLVSSGVYVCRLEAGDLKAVRKMVLLR